MKILVTGATGFLGRRLLAALSTHEVFALARQKPATATASKQVEWIEADLGRELDPRLLPARMDAVIHLAQSSRFREFPGGAADVFAVNVAAPASLMRWAVGAGVSRAVFASSGTVYEPYTSVLAEDAAVQPVGFYGASKLAAETLTLAYQNQFAVSHLRVFFLYGPTQTGMMISRLIDAVRSDAAITLPREGEGLELAPTFVDDAASVFAQACEESWRGIWNVAGFETVSLQALVEKIGLVAGRSAVIQRTDATPPAAIIPDLDKLRAKIDQNRFTSLDAGLRRTMF